MNTFSQDKSFESNSYFKSKRSGYLIEDSDLKKNFLINNTIEEDYNYNKNDGLNFFNCTFILLYFILLCFYFISK